MQFLDWHDQFSGEQPSIDLCLAIDCWPFDHVLYLTPVGPVCKLCMCVHTRGTAWTCVAPFLVCLCCVQNWNTVQAAPCRQFKCNSQRYWLWLWPLYHSLVCECISHLDFCHRVEISPLTLTLTLSTHPVNPCLASLFSAHKLLCHVRGREWRSWRSSPSKTYKS